MSQPLYWLNNKDFNAFKGLESETEITVKHWSIFTAKLMNGNVG